MDGACSSHVENRIAYRILVGEPEGKRKLEKLCSRCVDNIKLDLRNIVWGDTD
jgi:hypothetical protein